MPVRLGPLGLLAVVLLGSGCVLQPPAHTELPAAPPAWRNVAETGALPAGTPLEPATPAAALPPGQEDGDGFSEWVEPASGTPHRSGAEDWWRALRDPAIDQLVPYADANSASLAEAVARVAEARAGVGTARAAALPQLDASASAQRGTNTTVLPTTVEEQASGALNLSWEIDLFGRLRHGSAAAQAQLDARDSDARLTRLSLEAQVADTVLLRRACMLTLARERETLQSSETTLKLTQIKTQAGFSAPLDVARSRTSVGEARQAVVATEGECRRYAEVLVDLSGASMPQVANALADAAATPELPDAPVMAPALPATVLGSHPSLVSARRNADAAFEQVGQARAARLPSISLAGALSTSWIKFSQIDQGVNAWSIGPSLALPLFDGGSRDAAVEAARARYDQAAALLRQTLSDTVRDVELALIDGDTAQRQLASAGETSTAAHDLFSASRVAQQAGRLSLFDLEIARSSLLSAQTNLILARRDTARAWVALVKATGNGMPAPVPTRGGDPLPLHQAIELDPANATLADQDDQEALPLQPAPGGANPAPGSANPVPAIANPAPGGAEPPDRTPLGGAPQGQRLSIGS